MHTDSVIPELRLLTNHRLDTIDLDSKKILAIIRSLDVNKAHGWDDVSARMIKICDDSLVKPILNIFRCSFDSGKYPNNWKRGNLTPVHKKGDKNVIMNYRPVSLLPIMGKMFEKCIYDTLYSYFEKHNLFTPCQSGFRKNDSCISQLLSITHEIFKGFDANPPLGISREKIYSELGLESLSDRRYCRKLCFFYKIVNGYTAPYLSSYIPAHTRNCYVLRSKPAIKQLVARTERY